MTDEEVENERFSCASIDEKSDPAYPWARLAERLMDALTAARCERDEAFERGRAAERARMRAAVEQMMADAVHEVSDLRVMMRELGKTETTYADFTRSHGKLDTCERVLEMLDAHVGAGKGET